MLKIETRRVSDGWLATIGNVTEYGTTEAKARKACESAAMQALLQANRTPEVYVSHCRTRVMVAHADYARPVDPDQRPTGSYGYTTFDVATGQRSCSTGMAGTFADVCAAAKHHADTYGI